MLIYMQAIRLNINDTLLVHFFEDKSTTVFRYYDWKNIGTHVNEIYQCPFLTPLFPLFKKILVPPRVEIYFFVHFFLCCFVPNLLVLFLFISYYWHAFVPHLIICCRLLKLKFTFQVNFFLAKLSIYL